MTGNHLYAIILIRVKYETYKPYNIYLLLIYFRFKSRCLHHHHLRGAVRETVAVTHRPVSCFHFKWIHLFWFPDSFWCFCVVSGERGPSLPTVTTLSIPWHVHRAAAHAHVSSHGHPEPGGQWCVSVLQSRGSSLRYPSAILIKVYISLKWSFKLNSHLGCVSVMQSEIDASSPLMYGTPSSRIEGTPRSGIRGTPARQRADLGSVRKAKQVDIHSEPVRENPSYTIQLTRITS